MIPTRTWRRRHCPSRIFDIYPVSLFYPPLLWSSPSNHPLPSLCLHGCHGQNLAPLLALQLGAHSAVDSSADGIARLVEQDAGVVIEAHDGAVTALRGVSCADDNGVADIAALDLGSGGDASHAGGGGAALFLDDDDDAVTWGGKG